MHQAPVEAVGQRVWIEPAQVPLGRREAFVFKQIGKFGRVLRQPRRGPVVAAQRLGVLGADPKQFTFALALADGRPNLAGGGQRRAHQYDQKQYS
ncbi:hypothetical protein D9M73_263840 [compost metagenome]